ncbi:MAG: NAD(+)/NADH kinase [Verrucomicrobiae bacterium]|nr:NAD(+)/NADH kinase [Verrucomicrobiae bacterium]
MSSAAFTVIGLAAHAGKPECRPHLLTALRWLGERGVNVLLDVEAGTVLGRTADTLPMAQIGARAQLVVVLGGDGTILRVARELEDHSIPIFGINTGNLGFLTGARCDELAQALEMLFAGQYQISERQTLATVIERGAQQLPCPRALNDVVISRGAFSRIVRLELELDGELLTEYVCDGMIFATATGSTAYSLSAGGPILLPQTRAFVVTPICAHALSNRPIVAGRDSVVRGRVVNAAGELLLTVDGQVQIRLHVGDVVVVRRAGHVVRLVTPKGHSFFDVLRQKLKWSGANV